VRRRRVSLQPYREMDANTPNLNRRGFFRRAASIGAAALVAPSLAGLAACSAGAPPTARGRRTVGYGPLVQSAVPELYVPERFQAARLSTTTRPSLVQPAFNVGYAFDGMAAFGLPNGNVRLIRNHEVRDPAGAVRPLGTPARSYDARAGGGTTSLELKQNRDGSVELVAEFVSLSGTYTNCAGGPTPWGSWISCEETTVGPASGFDRPHGYCFEVPASAGSEVEPVPLKAMGRFVHEAVAVDPRTGIVYLTEDFRYDPTQADNPDPARRLPGSGFYRFLPRERGRLAAGGRLEMLAVRGQPRYLTVRGQRVGRSLPVAWVPIGDPDPADAERNPSAVFLQGRAQGGAIFQRLEGCWYGDGNLYFNSTSGGDAGAGQVWAYRPGGGDSGELVLIFESPSPEVLDSPDNLCVSPRGGLVICEDGAGVQFLRGLTPDGRLFDFVRTSGRSTETAGACFSPDGRTLFFNIQGGTSADAAAGSLGGTYAVWGPWEEGAL
jgi:secreted PhoX family phosphatase